MGSRRLKLNSDKTVCILVTAGNSIYGNVDINWVMRHNIPVQLSNSKRNLGFVSDKSTQLE